MWDCDNIAILPCPGICWRNSSSLVSPMWCCKPLPPGGLEFFQVNPGFFQLKWCFLFNLKIFEVMCFLRVKWVSTPSRPPWRFFMGIQKKKLSEAKARQTSFSGPLPVPCFEKKIHGKHPQYDVKVAFSDVDCAALFLKQRLKQHEVISKTIQFSSLKLIKSTRCLEKQRSLRKGQECQVWWELLVLQTGLGVEDVACGFRSAGGKGFLLEEHVI